MRRLLMALLGAVLLGERALCRSDGGERRTAHQGPGLQQDRRLPARLDPGRDHRDPATRRGERLHRDGHRGRRPVHDREPGPVPGGHLALHHRRRAERDPADGVPVLRRRGRRLRRRPRGGRHRVRLVLVRRPGRRLLRQPPGQPERRGQGRGPVERVDLPPAADLDPPGRVVQLPHQPPVRGPRPGLAGRVLVQRRLDGRGPPHHLVPELRRRPELVHRHGPHPGDLRRRELPPDAAGRHPDRGRVPGGRLPSRIGLHPALRRDPDQPEPMAAGRARRIHAGERHPDLVRRHGPALVSGPPLRQLLAQARLDDAGRRQRRRLHRLPDPNGDPWKPVDTGHEIQIDATDADPTRTTGSVYSFARPTPPCGTRR